MELRVTNDDDGLKAKSLKRKAAFVGVAPGSAKSRNTVRTARLKAQGEKLKAQRIGITG